MDPTGALRDVLALRKHTGGGWGKGLHLLPGGAGKTRMSLEAESKRSESGQRPRISFLSRSFSWKFTVTSQGQVPWSVEGGHPPCPASGSRMGPSRAEGGTRWGSCRCRASWGGSPSRTWRGRQQSPVPWAWGLWLRPRSPTPAPAALPRAAGLCPRAATRRRQTPRTRPAVGLRVGQGELGPDHRVRGEKPHSTHTNTQLMDTHTRLHRACDHRHNPRLLPSLKLPAPQPGGRRWPSAPLCRLPGAGLVSPAAPSAPHTGAATAGP